MQKKDIEKVSSKVIALRDTQVIIDRDVADIYGVTTRDINKAVKNNPTKFPDGYIISLSISEKKRTGGKFPPVRTLKTFNGHAARLHGERFVYAGYHHQK